MTRQLQIVSTFCARRGKHTAAFGILLLLVASTNGWALDAADPLLTRIELGKQLFQDSRLSRSGQIACRTCHEADKAFTDGRAVARGIDGKLGTRNSPSLLGAGVATSLFWDGRRASLEDQALDPFTNPREMGLDSEAALMALLQSLPEYVSRFDQAFAHEKPTLTPGHTRTAIASFLRSLPTATSTFDRYRKNPQHKDFSVEARRGLALFAGKANCASCHRLDVNPATFTDNGFHHSSIGWSDIAPRLPSITQAVVRENLQGEALGNRLTGSADWAALGRFVVTHRPADLGAFRTPSLRNVAVTAPYMHDGSVPTLKAAVEHEVYYRSLSTGQPITLTASEQRALVEFLHALTDESYAVKETGAATGKSAPY